MTGRAALALALTGCMADVGEREELTDTDFVSPVNPYIVANGMQQEDILANSLVAQTVTLKALIENPLRDETFVPGTGPNELAFLPATLENQIFLRHLVECALDGRDYVKFGGFRYQGAMGLAPEWHDDKPTQEELELVSGCMLTFVNLHGESVLVNARGLTIDDVALSIDGPVRAYAYKPDPVATPLPSFFATCSPLESGAARNCGWVEFDAYVGTCSPGAVVNVGAGARVGDCTHPLGSSSGDTVLRACSGLRACDFGSSTHLTSSDNTCGVKPAVRFFCPSSGEFSVMVASSLPLMPYRAIVKAKGAGVRFPAKVNDLYEKNKEGAFFGNVLNPEKLNPNFVILPGENDRGPIIQIGKGNRDHTGLGDPEIYLYEDAWACHDPNWTQGDAYMHERNCAIATVQPIGGGPPEQANLCVARPLGECSQIGNELDDPAARCQIYDSHVELGDFDYDDCADDTGAIRRYPITSYLDEPCDLMGEQRKDLCARK